MKQFHINSITLALGLSGQLSGAEPDSRPAKGIQDNSFLIEEAYNQEPGVVQHIFNFRRDVNKRPGADDQDWHLTFTQEWPIFSQTHQFSYTLPYSFLKTGSERAGGLGDILLNYRLQALYESESSPAFAPRASLVLPTGDESEGLGSDSFGLQFNLPFSKIVHNRWTVHANAGSTLLFDVHDENPVNFNLGASAIYAVHPNFNLMLEMVGEWSEEVGPNGRTTDDFQAVISPGLRYAFNFPAGQLVVGLGAPIGLNSSAPDYGAIFYLSWEHRFLADKNPKVK